MNLQARHLHLIPEKDLRPDLKLARLLAVLQDNGRAAHLCGIEHTNTLPQPLAWGTAILSNDLPLLAVTHG